MTASVDAAALTRAASVAQPGHGSAQPSQGNDDDLGPLRAECDRFRAELASVTAQRTRLEQLLTHGPAVIYALQAFGAHAPSFVTPNLTELLGYPPELFLRGGGFWISRVHPEDLPAVLGSVPQLLASGHQMTEYRFRTANGRYVWLRDEQKLCRDPDGRPLHIVGYLVNVTEARRASRSIARANAELEAPVAERTAELETSRAALERELTVKSVLLREIHHRVKNNLQLVCSLLNLQTDPRGDGPAHHALQSSDSRVRTLALVHELIYQSSTLEEAPLDAFLEGLVTDLRRTFSAPAARVELDVEPGMTLPLDSAAPVALILRELVANALQHGHRAGSASTLRIRARRSSDERQLEVADEGEGFDPAARDAHGTGLGLKLVEVLVRQLRGRSETHCEGGTRVCVSLPDRPADGRRRGA